MTLDPGTLKQRIVAARQLRGLDQEDLGRLFKADGLGFHDPGRIERGTMTMQVAHRRAFAHHLGLPETYFIDEDVGLPDLGSQEERIERALRGLSEQLAALQLDVQWLAVAIGALAQRLEVQIPARPQPASESRNAS